MLVPEDLLYSETHEWVRDDGGRLVVGITDYAQDALGDVVFVERVEVGRSVEANEPVGEIESTKSVSELYAPIAGSVAAANEEVFERPELVNEDPYGRGWLFAMTPARPGDLRALMPAAAYQAYLDGLREGD